MRTSRTKLRTLRRSPKPGRSGSEAPGRMERSDAPRQIAESDLVETGSGDHLGELALPRETPDAFDKIGVGVAITGDNLTEQRYELEAEEVVERLKRRGDFGREFETHKAPARFEHAARLGESRIDPSDVTQSEADRVEIDAAVGHREPLGIGAHPFDPLQNSLVESSGASDRQHRLADVADHGAAIGAPSSGKARQGAHGDVAGA